MKMGRRFGEKVGWVAGEKGLPHKVEVRIVNGKFMPCQSCHWFNVCVVPKARMNMSINKAAIRNVYQCIDFIDRNSSGYEQWYRAPYDHKRHGCGRKEE